MSVAGIHSDAVLVGGLMGLAAPAVVEGFGAMFYGGDQSKPHDWGHYLDGAAALEGAVGAGAVAVGLLAGGRSTESGAVALGAGVGALALAAGNALADAIT